MSTSWLRLSVCLVFAGCAGHAASVTAPPPITVANPVATPAFDDQPLPLDPSVRHGVLANGLSYYVRANAEPLKKASLRLVVNAGSVLETDEERGLAHVVEHTSFLGTNLFSGGEITQFRQKLGQVGRHSNATTSFDWTRYILEVPTDDGTTLPQGLLLLQQFASAVKFDPAAVEVARAAVIEEERGRRGAGQRVRDAVDAVVLRGSQYAVRAPIGTLEVLQRFKASDLEAFYRRWYRPNLMAVIAVGDFDPAVIEAEIRRLFEPLSNPADAVALPSAPVPDHDEMRVVVAKDPELTGTSVELMQKLPAQPRNSRRAFRRRLVESLSSRMLNQRLAELRLESDPPFLGAGVSRGRLVRTKDEVSISASVKQDGILRGLETLTREIERVRRHGFTESELAREKLNFLRGYERGLKESETRPSVSFVDELTRYFLAEDDMPGRKAELALATEFLPGITLADANGFAASFSPARNRVIAVRAPAAATVPAEDQMRAASTTAAAASIAAYDDKVPTGPLTEKLRPPGKIVHEGRIAELDIVEWRLSNGVRVLIKPTDFRKDQILMSAFSPGGHSRTKDADFPSALYTAEVVTGSGLGRLDQTELRKALAGKPLSFSLTMNEFEEGFSGWAPPADLGTLLELVYLGATAPRRNEKVFAAVKERLDERLARRDASPDVIYRDKWTSVLFGEHPRRQPPTQAFADRVSLDGILRVYHDRFDVLDGLTVMFVGNVDLPSMRPLVEKYLGALPVRGHKEAWRDVGARPTSTAQTFEVTAGREPKAQVNLVYLTPGAYVREEEHRLESLAELERTRLREVLRTKLGGVYGVSVTAVATRRPSQYYRFSIDFTCAPDNVDKLVAAVKAELASARSASFSADEINTIKTNQRWARAEARRTNAYWLARVMYHLAHGSDPRLILKSDELTEKIDDQALLATARKYLDEKHLIVGTLKPRAANAAPAVAGTTPPKGTDLAKIPAGATAPAAGALTPAAARTTGTTTGTLSH